MTVVIEPASVENTIHRRHERKISKVLKLFRRIMQQQNHRETNEVYMRSRRHSNHKNNNLHFDENFYKIRDLDKFYGQPITDAVISTSSWPKSQNKNAKSKPQKTITKKSKAQDTLKVVYHAFDTYCDNTTLHGLRYVGDAKLTVPERIFWFVAFFCAVCFAGYFISNIYNKYNNSPVIISFNPTAATLEDIPFPAVTVCNLNQAAKSEALKILDQGTDIQKNLLDDYCNSNSSVNFTQETYEHLTNWEVVKKFLENITQPCSKMFRHCEWRQSDVPCNQLFSTYFTDDGLCCSFNRLPSTLIFRNPKEVETDYSNFTVGSEDWNPQRGFSSNTYSNTTPLRSPGAGSHIGLTVVLDADIDEYFCSSTSSAGFKVLLSNPIETPKMADFGFLVSAGIEARIVIDPTISDATSTLESIELSKRQCYFAQEKYLKYYRTYTQRNCQLECQSNYTLQKCGCVPFYLPRNRKTKICGKLQDVCITEAKIVMEIPSSDIDCQCIPGCFELSYSKSLSTGQLLNNFKIKENIIENVNPTYFVKNMAVMHFFYEKSTFTKRTKSEIYGFTEFLSNTGGLLGLFLGFSFLSAVEVGYYLSLKMFCNYVRLRRKNKTVKDDSVCYPFTK